MTQKTDTKDPLKNIGYTPFLEPVHEREYTKPNFDASEVSGELEEPTFKAPSLDDFEEMDKAEEQLEEKKDPPRTFNPQYNELGNKEKQMGAEMLADVTLDGYKKLCRAMGNFAKVSESKLDQEFAEGKITPDLEIPLDEYGNTAKPREYFEELNKESEIAFEVSDEFVNNVRPPLIRVYKKKGIGLTDEQLLLYYGITDISTKGIVLFQLKKNTNNILENMRLQTEYLRTNGQPTATTNETRETRSESEAKAKADFMAKDFVEPEERDEEFHEDIIIDSEGKMTKDNFAETKTPENMPKFGDKKLLEDMERIAENEQGDHPVITVTPIKPKRKYTKRKKTSKPKK